MDPIVTRMESPTAAELYLELLKKCLTGSLGDETLRVIEPVGLSPWLATLYAPISAVLRSANLQIVRKSMGDIRASGRDWPVGAETMVGIKRLDNLQFCISDIIARGVVGDLVETGVWRGGASIFMRGVLKAYHETERIVWAADSFAGLPEPNASRSPADSGDRHHQASNLAVSLDEVSANFAKYGLLDEQVRFVVGWFQDTLPAAPIDRIAVLRLDGDMYESTKVALESLYPKVTVGGYIVVDDYWNEQLPAKLAVDDFRTAREISDVIHRIDWTGAFWQRTR